MNISLRTAQRYLSEMSYLPGVCYDDTEHCWYMTDKYGLSESYLKQDELAVLSGLFDYAENILQNEYSGMLKRIKKKVITASNRENIIRFMKSESIDFEKIADVFTELENHILLKEEITFVYSRNGKSYRVYPYRIIFGDGFWYLLAEKEGQIRKFGLDLLTEMKTTGKHYDSLPEGLDREIDSAVSIFFDPHGKTEVTCTISKEMGDYIKRKKFFPKQEIIATEDDGTVTFKFTAGSAIECFKLCVIWIPHIRVVSPPEFKEYFTDALKKALE